VEENKKNLDKNEFFIALKLISIKQAGKLFDDAVNECKKGILLKQ